MEIISFIIRLIPVVLLIMFIVSLIIFLTSPKGSKKRTTWMVLAIVFGALNAVIVLFYLAIMIIMMAGITYM